MFSKRGEARWRASAVALVLAVGGSAGLVAAGAQAARADAAAGAADQACVGAGGTATDFAQGLFTQCVLTSSGGQYAFTWTPPANTRAVTYDLYGAQGAPQGVVASPGHGGEVTGTFAAPSGPVQINLGSQWGFSGPYSPDTGGGNGYYVGGYSGIGTTGGGASVVYAVSAGITHPMLVAGGGGGSGMSGVDYIGYFTFDSAVPNGGNGGAGPATDGSQGQTAVGGYNYNLIGGAGGRGGSNGGAGGDGSDSGDNIGNGGYGHGGSATYSGGGGGGYVGGGAGGEGQGNDRGVAGSGGGGGGSSWAGGGVTGLVYHDGVQTGDGKAVITTMNGVGQYSASGFIFRTGQTLASGAVYATSQYALVMQADGNLVAYDWTGAAVWSSGTGGHPGAHAILQADGDFVIYADAAQTQPLWWTGSNNGGTNDPSKSYALFTSGGELDVDNFQTTGSSWNSSNVFSVNGASLGSGENWMAGNGAYQLSMQSDGNLVVSSHGSQIWASGTWGHPGAHAVLQSDGNFVIYSPGTNGWALWWTGTGGSGATRMTFNADGSLTLTNGSGGIVWTSANSFTTGMRLVSGAQFLAQLGKYELVMQSDGNLVEYNSARNVIWSSNTAGHNGASAVMQNDGNFVIYDASGHALWATGTNGSGATRFVFQNDGNLVMYRANGSVAWASNTQGK